MAPRIHHRFVTSCERNALAPVGLVALIGLCATPLLLEGCSGSDSPNITDNGAVADTGGASGHQGGSSTTGTSSASGGASAAATGQSLGGSTASGGTFSMAGGQSSVAGGTGDSLTGGTRSTGGSETVGGKSSSGGSGATGGTSTTGGRATGGTASGGSKPTGGTVSSTGGSSGGAVGTGGTQSSGGTKATGGSAATGGTSSTAGTTGCFTAPAAQVGTQAPASTVSGYGTVLIWAKTPHPLIRLQTTMVVPPKPPASGTLFLWPGIQPDGANFQPIDNGVLQPVLTWGPACSPGTKPKTYSTWWISGQYVNTNGSVPGYTDCNGGPIMSVNVCDTLNMDIALSGTTWTQTVTDVQTSKTVTYSIDLQNQEQNLAYFVIEEYDSTPVSEVIFTDTTLTFGTPDAADCKVYMRGKNDYVSTPVASSDGLRCSIQQIILRAQGI